jgi:hypothetical protein
MKNLKRYLSILLLLIAFSCQTDDFKTDVIPDSPKSKVNFLSADDIPLVLEKISTPLGIRSISGASNQSNSLVGIIRMDEIMQVIDTLGNENYTFSIDDQDNNHLTFSNLIVPMAVNGDRDPFLMKYEMDSSYFPHYIKHGFSIQTFKGKITRQFINGGANDRRGSAALENRSINSDGCDPDTYFDGSGGDGSGGYQPLDPYQDWGPAPVFTGGGRCSWQTVYPPCDQQIDDGEDYALFPHTPEQCGRGTGTPSGIILIIDCSQADNLGSANDGNCDNFGMDELGLMYDPMPDYMESIALSLPQQIFSIDPELIWQWMWQNGYVNPYGAGFIDGFRQTVGSLFNAAEFTAAWDVANSTSFYSPEAYEKRLQTLALAELIRDLATSASFRTQFWNSLKTEINNYVDETLALTPQAMYNQGKLVFDVASLFVGIGEVNTLLKTGSLTLGLVAVLKSTPKAFAAALTSAKKLGMVVVRSGDNILIKSANGTDELARIIGNVMEFNYSGFGGKIVTNPNKTTTVIGKWENQIENMWNTGLAKQGQNTGGMNILGDVPNGTVLEKWNFNKQWLDEAISRGDVIRVSADPLDINSIFYDISGVPSSKFSNLNTLKNYLLNLTPDEISQLGYFGREVRHLFQNGYNFNISMAQFTK